MILAIALMGNGSLPLRPEVLATFDDDDTRGLAPLITEGQTQERHDHYNDIAGPKVVKMV